MSEKEIGAIADRADMIIAGYAFTKENDEIRVLNLNNTKEACVLSVEGEMLSTNMNDVTLSLVQAYYRKNRQFMEEDNA